jgi:site-specific DNA recombinase
MLKARPNEPEMPRVAIYTRVSSEEQVKNHYSLNDQRTLCYEKLNHLYGENLYVARVFEDPACKGRWGLYDPHSPRRKHRPQLTLMHDAFKRGEFDVICVYKMNRLWRKAASGDFLLDYFVPHGLTRVISCTESIDISTASGRFQLNIAAAVGAYEAEQLGEWVSDALQQRKRDGYKIGVPFGWRAETDEEKQGKRRGIRPRPEQAKVVAEMAERACNHESLRMIARWLNRSGIPTSRRGVRWTTSVVKRILLNPTHAGLVSALSPEGEEVLIPGAHEAYRFYDPERYHQMVGLLTANKGTSVGYASSPEHLLGGLLRCGHCGRRVNGRMVKRLKARIYRCSTGAAESIPECMRNSERAEAIENLILSELRGLAADQSVLDRAEANVRSLLSRQDDQDAEEERQLRKRLGQLWTNYRHWSDQRTDGKCEEDEFDFHVQAFRHDKAEVEARIREIESQRSLVESRDALLKRAREWLSDFGNLWQSLPMSKRREALLSLVEEAAMWRLDDGRTEVRFRLRGFPEMVRYAGRLKSSDRPETGLESLTPRQQVGLYWYSQKPDRAFVAKKMGVKWQCANGTLWKAYTQLGCTSPEEAWAVAKEFIIGNLDWLPLKGRARREEATPRDAPLLTEAQVRVLSLTRQGLTPAKIGEAQQTSVNTIYVQLRDARLRLGVATNEEAVEKAVSLGLIS